jgi:hypothetical protein
MYQVAFNTKGPEKRNGDFCTAGLVCKKCHWFIKNIRTKSNSFGDARMTKSVVCSFNKKPYDDMHHKLFVYEGI